MRHLLTGIAALLLGLVVLPAFADDKDKKDPAPDAKKDEPNTEKTIKAGVVAGKLIQVNETGKSITLEVAYDVPKPNVGEIQAAQNAQIQLAQAIAKRDYNGAAQAQRDYAYHSARTTTVEHHTQNVDITGTDDLKVRLTNPPVAFDDKGNIKKYTEKELKELKGDPKDPDYKLPGYPGAFSDLRQGAYVKVTLVKKKETGPKPKEADAELLGDNMPQASMIEILGEPMQK